MSPKRTLETIHPLSKLAWVINTSVVAGAMSTPVQLLWLALMLILIFVFLSRITVRSVVKYWRILLTVPLLLFAFHLFLYPVGGPQQRQFFHWRFLHITPEGLSDASLYSLRFFCSIFALVLFLSTTEIKPIIVGLIRLRVPVAFSYAIYLMLRSVPVMGSEAVAITQALKTRVPGWVPIKAYWLLWWRYVFALVLMGVRRGEQTALAMDARGFSMAQHRTFLREPQWSATGVLFLLGNLLVAWGIDFFT